jgi:hypothetical protein
MWPSFLTYGNWGGPGWSGGKFVHDPALVDWMVPAIDEMDKAFKWHDAQWQTKAVSKLEADRILMRNLYQVRVVGLWPNIYRIGAIIGFWIMIHVPWRN